MVKPPDPPKTRKFGKKLFTEKFLKNLEGWESRRAASQVKKAAKSQRTKDYKKGIPSKSTDKRANKRQDVYPSQARQLPLK